MADEPKVPTTSRPPASRPFRFSLLTLLSITTLAGFVSAVLFSKGLDPFERVLMAFWCAGLILGLSVSRARGRPGILSAGLGAALGCALATFFLHTGDYRPADYVPILTFVIVAGWLLAVGAAAFYHTLLTGLMEELWRKRMIRRVSYILGGVVIACFVVWQAGRTPLWKPAWEQHVDFRSVNSQLAAIALSPEGERLIMNVWYRPQDVLGADGYFPGNEELKVPIHKLTTRGLVPESLSLPWSSAAIFAPDGMRIALRQGRRYQMYDARTGALIWETTLELNSLEVILDQQFSADGRQLFITTRTPRIQRLRVIDVDDGLEAPPELFPFAGELYVSEGSDKLVKYHDSRDENHERSLEIVDLASRESICRLNDIAGIARPTFSLAGDRLAIGTPRVWELPDGRSKPVGGNIALGLLSNGRTLVVDDVFPDHWRDFLPVWLQQMPFVHHLVAGEQKSQLRISNEHGQTILATPWLENVRQVELSANQRVAVTISGLGQIRIWKVPE